MKSKIIRTLWALVLIPLATLLVGFLFLWIWTSVKYDDDEISNPINSFASQVYASNGELIGTWNLSKDNRVPVKYDALSPYLVQALISTEDERFYEHSGIDFYALGRAILKRGVMGEKAAGGGSTITQQLAKMRFSDVASSVFDRMLQKPIEWIIAMKLERKFTKEEILQLYLNKFDFLYNAAGVKVASNTYFNKEPKNLSLIEAATLVGMCKNPSYFNPVRYPERCTERRNVVLQQMVKNGYLTQAQYETESRKETKLNFRTVDHKEGPAPYFREFLRQYLMEKEPLRENYQGREDQYFIDSMKWAQDPAYGWCNKNKKADGTFYNIYTDGLKVYTTVDLKMQRYAEEAVYEHVVKQLQPMFNADLRGKANAPYSSALSRSQIDAILLRTMKQTERWRAGREAGMDEDEIKAMFYKKTKMKVFTYRGEKDTTITPLDSIKYYKSFLRSGFVCIRPDSGDVKAYVGGLDFAHFQYDMAFGGRRQVGSTIKPYLYSLAVQNGMTPCDLVPNVAHTYGNWTPRNASRARYGSNVPLRWGLAQSNNWISAYLIDRFRPEMFVNMLGDYGIYTPPVHRTMALCLGPLEITVGEMVSGYSTFVNKGMRVIPRFVTRIEDSEGNLIVEFKPTKYEVISEDAAYKMLELLQAVVNEGTGQRLRGIFPTEMPIGGKTGTTNRNSDGWFMGVTPELVAGCWVGGEDRDIHFDNGRIGQGASLALPVWGIFMKKVYSDCSLPYSQSKAFDFPQGYDPCNEKKTSSLLIDEVFE